MQMQFMKIMSGASNKGNLRFPLNPFLQGEPMGSASLMPPNPLLQGNGIRFKDGLCRL